MPTVVEIGEVSQFAHGEAGLRGGYLDRPTPGDSEAGSLEVRGWAVPEDGAIAWIEVTSAAHVVGYAMVDRPRPDIEALYPDSPGSATSGFALSLNLAGVREELGFSVLAVAAGGNRFRIGSFGARRRRAPGVAGRSSLVSVVIPCFNQAHYLPDAIESALGQTHDDVEVIVVDDGSEDNTGEVAGRYPGVRCVRQSNRGLAAARNAGTAQCHGEFVAFVDADDRLLPAALETNLARLSRKPEAVLAAGRVVLIGPDGSSLPGETLPVANDDPYAALLRACFILAPTALHRRRALEEMGGFDASRRAGEDYRLYLRIARRHAIDCHDVPVAEYRRHGSNMTRDPGRILRSELTVLRREWLHARRRGQREAYRAGIRRARELHGGALALQARTHLHQRRWGMALRDMAKLARWHPRAMTAALRDRKA